MFTLGSPGQGPATAMTIHIRWGVGQPPTSCPCCVHTMTACSFSPNENLFAYFRTETCLPKRCSEAFLGFPPILDLDLCLLCRSMSHGPRYGPLALHLAALHAAQRLHCMPNKSHTVLITLHVHLTLNRHITRGAPTITRHACFGRSFSKHPSITLLSDCY